MPQVNAGKVNLHYLTVGRGPDVVMLHGFLGIWPFGISTWFRRFDSSSE